MILLGKKRKKFGWSELFVVGEAKASRPLKRLEGAASCLDAFTAGRRGCSPGNGEFALQILCTLLNSYQLHHFLS